MLDVLGPGLALGCALGWLACTSASCAYGKPVWPDQPVWFLAADLPDAYGVREPRVATQWLGAGWSLLVGWLQPGWLLLFGGHPRLARVLPCSCACTAWDCSCWDSPAATKWQGLLVCGLTRRPTQAQGLPRWVISSGDEPRVARSINFWGNDRFSGHGALRIP